MKDCPDFMTNENATLKEQLDSFKDFNRDFLEVRAENERLKDEIAMAHRVVENHKQQANEAVRIGCENITAREKAEAENARLTEKLTITEEALDAAEKSEDEQVQRAIKAEAEKERLEKYISGEAEARKHEYWSISAQRDQATKERAEFMGQRDRAVEALKVYADENNWGESDGWIKWEGPKREGVPYRGANLTASEALASLPKPSASKPCPMLMMHNGDGTPTPGCTCLQPSAVYDAEREVILEARRSSDNGCMAWETPLKDALAKLDSAEQHGVKIP